MRSAILIGIAYGIFAALFVFLAMVLYSRAFAYPLVAKCDQDRNGVINSADLAGIAAGWGTTSGDVNLDGVTNSTDLAGCAAAFNRWAYPDGPNPDDAAAIATIDALPPDVQTAQVTLPTDTPTAVPTATNTPGAICPECPADPTAPVPTP